MNNHMRCGLRALVIGLSSVALVAVLVGQAWSQGDGADQREEAKRHFRAGQQAYNAGQYMVAARAFEESYKLLPIPEIAFSTAQAYRLQYFVDKEARWLERAIELYREYIDKKPKGGRRDVAITHLAELEPILLRMKAEGANMQGDAMAATQVMITSSVPGAEGEFQGKKSELPMVLDLEPGTYEVRVSAPGYAPTTRSFQALAGRFVPVEVSLESLAARVRVKTESGASITVDGRPEGETPLLAPLTIGHGSHFIAVSKRGHRPWTRQVELERGQEIEFQADLRTTTQRKISYVFAGTAGASIIAGTVTAVLAGRENRKALELEERNELGSMTLDELRQYNDAKQTRNALVGGTIVLYGFASLTATIGGLLWYLDNPKVERPPPPDKKAPEEPAEDTLREISFVPTVSPDMAGFAVSGRF